MKREQTFRSLQNILILLAGILSVIFLLILVPMVIHLHNLNNKNLSQKEELAQLIKDGFVDINHSLRSQQNYVKILQKRIDSNTTNFLKFIQLPAIPEEFLQKMKSPDFSLDYFNGSRNEIAANITQKAADKQVALEAAILANEPQVPPDWSQSEVANTAKLYELWINLIGYERVVTSLIGAAPTKIDTITIKPIFVDKTSLLTNMVQIPIDITFTGTTESVVQFLRDFNNRPGPLKEEEEEKQSEQEAETPAAAPAEGAAPAENPPAEVQPTAEQPKQAAETPIAAPAEEATPTENPPEETQPTAEEPAKPAVEQPEQAAETPAAAPAEEATPTENPPAEAQPTAEESAEPAPEPEPEPDPKHFPIFLDSFVISIAPSDPNLVIFRGTICCIFDTTPLVGDNSGGKQK